jgi:hypothetical protein
MNAYIRIVVFILSLSMMPSLSSAQSRCPYGTEYAGILSGQGTDIEKLDRHETIKLPEKVTLDESYQQTRLTASNDTGKKNTNLRPQDVPKGILIIPTGSRDYPVRWAVSEPKLTAFERDKNGTITQYEFEMHLFCSMETSEFDRQTNSCNVDVVVCFKPMK